MVVGPSGGSKTENIDVLSDCLGMLKDAGIKGNKYERVRHYKINPKAITMNQLYGAFDPIRELSMVFYQICYRNAQLHYST